MTQNKIFMTSLAFGAMLLTAQMVEAQSRNCAPRAAVVERLAERFEESRQMVAMNGERGVLEMYASEESGSWTITITNASGLTCIVAAGEDYQYVAEALPNLDQDA